MKFKIQIKLTRNSEASSDATVHEHIHNKTLNIFAMKRAEWLVLGIFRDGCSVVAELDATSANVTLTILISLNLELRTLHDSLWIT